MAKKKKTPANLDDLKAEYPWLAVLVDSQQSAINACKGALIGARAMSCGSYTCCLSDAWNVGDCESMCPLHRDIACALSKISETEPYETKNK